MGVIQSKLANKYFLSQATDLQQPSVAQIGTFF